MGNKLTLTDVANLQNEQTVVNVLTANNRLIEDALENTLSRNGQPPNEMDADIDLNGQTFYNLAAPSRPTSPVRKQDLDAATSSLSTAVADAQQYATDAEGAALNSQTSSDAASTALQSVQTTQADVRSTFYGRFATAPTTSPSGGAIQSGAMYYNTASNSWYFFDGSVWQIFQVTNYIQRRQTFSATASQTVFTVTGGYIPSFGLVTYNGVILNEGTDVDTSNGSTFTLASGATAGAEITFIGFGTFNVANALQTTSNLADVPNKTTALTNLGAVPTTRQVAGKPLSADITIAKADVGLGNVDNTSDVNKPVSTAQQTALNAKAALTGGNSWSGTQTFAGTWFGGGTVQISSGAGSWSLGVDCGATGGAGGGLGVNRSNSIGWAIAFYQGGASVGSIGTTNSTTSFNTTSDVRLKTDFQPIDADTFFDQVKVYDYAWLDREGNLTGERGLGVVAQELYQIEPRAVDVGQTVTNDDGTIEERYWSVDYSKLVPVLIQELINLRARVATLEGKVNV